MMGGMGTDVSTEAVAARRPGRPRSAEADAAITSAVVEQILEHGYHNLSLDRVAEAAGVSKATIYRRWSSKEEVVVAAFASCCEKPDLDVDHTDLAALRTSFVRYVDTVAGPAGALMVHLAGAAVADEGLRDALRAFGEEQRAPVLAAIAAAQARGEIVADVPPRHLCDLVSGVLFYRHMTGDRPLTRDEALRLYDGIVQGFTPAPAAVPAPAS
jgi:AcrR family transcriptional regulator